MTARRLLLGLGLLLGILAVAAPAVAQPGARLDDAARAVVRIRGCDSFGCERGVGSGVIVDPGGVILTANHVTLSDPNEPFSDVLEDFVIELTEDAREAPLGRYRARLVASDRARDVALLQVNFDETTGRDVEAGTLQLPTLPIAVTESIGLGEPLHILGYPLAGGQKINYEERPLSGFDADPTLLKVTGSLGQGYSGGPALIEQEGGFAVAGIVVRQRDMAMGQVGLIRSLDQLANLEWTRAAQRVWVADVTIEPAASDALLAMRLVLHSLDLAGRHGRLLVYVFDAARRPWPAPDAGASTTSQLVLHKDVQLRRFLDVQEVAVAVPKHLLGAAPETLALRLVFWDADGMRAWWRDPQWRSVQAVAMAPTVAATAASPVPTPTETTQPTATSTAIPMSTSTPTATTTPTPAPPPSDTPTVAPTPTETTQPTATSTATSIPASTPTATPTPTPAAPAAGTVREFGGIRFVYVPPGEFRMGSSDAEVQRAIELCRSYPDDGGGDCATKFEDERPTRPVYLDAFWIMQTEITNAQFASFVNSSGYLEQRYWSEEGWNWRKGEGITQPGYWSDARLNEPQQPAVGLSWFEAEAFTNWFGQQSGLPARLPTEEEWEKAARDADGRFFPWGNDWNGSNANFCDRSCNLYAWADPNVNDGYAFTAPVGMYPAGASSYGALDMAGNVWEWVANRARRGGSWTNDPEGLRTTERLYDDRYTRTNTLEFPSKAGTGFRLVISDY